MNTELLREFIPSFLLLTVGLCSSALVSQKFQNDTNSSIGRGSKDDVVALLEESVLCRLEEDLHTGDLYNGSFSDCSMGYNCSMNHDQLLVAEITVITCTDPFGEENQCLFEWYVRWKNCKENCYGIAVDCQYESKLEMFGPNHASNHTWIVFFPPTPWVVLGATGAIAVLSVLVLGCLIHIVKNRNKEVYDVARRGKPTGRATLAACRTYSLDVDELSPRSSATSRL